MEWLMAIVVLIMAAGLIGTLMIGQSQSNREENSRYSQQTGRNWLRLSGIYVIGIAAVAVILIVLLQ